MTKTNVLCFVPELAAVIGLNEAIVLNQIHYWIEKNRGDEMHYRDGRTWTFNTYKEWQEQFPFWGTATIVRTFEKLEKNGFIISGNFNKMKYDRTKWYSVNYDKVNEVLYQIDKDLYSNGYEAFSQIDKSQNIDMIKPIPENTTENTQREYSPPLVSDVKEDERVGYGEYGWVRLTDDEVISLLVKHGEEAVNRGITYIDISAQKTNNRNGWFDWCLTVDRAISENWGGILNGIS